MAQKSKPRALVYEMLNERTYDLKPFIHPKRLHPSIKAPLESAEGKVAHNTLTAWRLIHTHVANEMLDARLLGAAQRQGMRVGWPDFFVGVGGRAIFIELKRLRWAGWAVSQAQFDVIKDLRSNGFVAEIAWGAAHMLSIVEQFRG